MPRHKQRDKHLPPRLRRKGAYFYYVAGQTWKPLGKDYVRALLQWREIEGLCEGAATVAQMLDNAFAAMVGELKPGTIREFTRACNRLKNGFKDFAPADVEPVHISQYLKERADKDGHPRRVAANREIAFFSSAWEVARARGWISLPNPALGVKRNKERSRKRTATPAEVRALLFNSSGQLRDCVEADCVMLTLKTGLRESDLLHFNKRLIEAEGLRVKPRKTDESTEAEQLFPWDRELRACVERLLARRRRVGSIYLVPVQRGKRAGQPYSSPSWFKVWRPYFTECGVEGLTWHDLRRTALNRKKRESGIEGAQEMGAHSSVTTTEGYLESTGTIEVMPLRISSLVGENMRNSPRYENDRGRTNRPK